MDNSSIRRKRNRSAPARISCSRSVDERENRFMFNLPVLERELLGIEKEQEDE
jgi:hypothetical protein